MEIASNGFPNLGVIGSSVHQHKEALDPEFKLIQLLEGRVDPLMVGVWPRKLKAREAIAYFQYSDANGARLADRGKRRRLWIPYFRKCFEIRGGVIVWTTRPPKHFPYRRDDHDNRRSHDKTAAVWPR